MAIILLLLKETGRGLVVRKTMRSAVSAVNLKTSKMEEGFPLVNRKENESTDNRKAPFYDHPVFREISLSNGKINKMKKDEVKKILKERGLDTR